MTGKRRRRMTSSSSLPPHPRPSRLILVPPASSSSLPPHPRHSREGGSPESEYSNNGKLQLPRQNQRIFAAVRAGVIVSADTDFKKIFLIIQLQRLTVGDSHLQKQNLRLGLSQLYGSAQQTAANALPLTGRAHGDVEQLRLASGPGDNHKT